MTRFTRGLAAFGASAALLSSCAAGPPTDRAGSEPASLLVRSDPAQDAVLATSPEALTLEFSRPVRLVEVVIQGGDGSQVPIMIASAGEVTLYSVPIPELQPGDYTASWRAEGAGGSHRGAVRFRVR